MKKGICIFLAFFAVSAVTCTAKAVPSENKNILSTQADYIKGRKLTDKEIKEQQKHEPKDLQSSTFSAVKQREEYNNKQKENGQTTASYAAKYDARDYNLVTKVKDQKNSEWCWDFAVISCAETSMIKNKIRVGGTVATAKNTDLSEAAVAYYLYNRDCAKDPLGGSNGDKNIYKEKTETIRDYLGDSVIAANFLTTWMGAKNESYYSIGLGTGEKITKPDVKKAYSNNDAVIKNIINIFGDGDVIKQAVKDYGSACIAIYWNNKHFNYDTAAYYNPNPNPINHYITIVGWDDTYSKTNFKNSGSIKKDGAWIIKNSWSDEWGDEGYFYLSYEDASIYTLCAVEMQSAASYNNNYFYDGTASDLSSSVNNNGMIANEFIAKGNTKGNGKETLEAVSFVLEESYAKYSIQVYTNIKDPKNPTSGEKALSKEVTGTLKSSGFYTVELNEPVTLTQGERYSVVIQVSSPSAEDIYYGVEGSYEGELLSFVAETSANQSFYKNPGSSSWTDLSKSNKCARIKAYTNNYKKVVFRDGTKVLKTQYVAKGDAATAPVATKTGYTFVKWDKSYKNVQGDMYVNAVWKGYSYTVRFNSNGGKNTMKDMACVYGTNISLTANIFTRSGYSFLGFNKKSDGSSTWYRDKANVSKLTSKKNGIVTLYAQWAKNTKITSLKSTKRGTLTVKYAETDSKQTGYQIVYSTNRNFTSSTTKKISITGYKNTSKTITGLAKGKKYYVKVRTYKKVGNNIYYGVYSSAKAVIIKK